MEKKGVVVRMESYCQFSIRAAKSHLHACMHASHNITDEERKYLILKSTNWLTNKPTPERFYDFIDFHI